MERATKSGSAARRLAVAFRDTAWRASACALALGLARAGAQGAPEAPPNIVLIVADDLGWRDLACQGSRYYETPNLDRLAREGTRFTHGYANAPNCAPTRACLMTGLYTPRHGIYTVAPSARGQSRFRKLVPTETEKRLDEALPTIASVLSARGYRTGFFGKWHLSDDARRHGFDVNVGGCSFGHPKSYTSPYRNPQLKDGPKGEYLTERMAAEACAFVARNKTRPFYCQLSFYAVHTPIRPKAGTAARFRDKAADGGQKNARYAAMIATMDAGVGRLMATLAEHELERRTLVVFVSDNGGLARVTSNAPLRGGKGMLYEGGIRVPWIVRMPGRVPAGRVDETPVITSDLLRSFASFAGVPRDEIPDGDGVDLTPRFEGRPLAGAGAEERDGGAAPRALFWHFPAYLAQNAKKGTWRTTPASAMRLGRYKLLHFFEDDRLELYDLREDPSETRDLASEKPGLVVDLEHELAKWRLATEAPIPSERNPEYEGGDKK